MYLPQPVASCLRSPPEATQLPALVPVLFHPSAPSPVDFVHACWKFKYPLSLAASRHCAVLSRSGYFLLVLPSPAQSR